MYNDPAGLRTVVGCNFDVCETFGPHFEMCSEKRESVGSSGAARRIGNARRELPLDTCGSWTLLPVICGGLHLGKFGP